MATETREVQVCDQCGTHHGVSEWPQYGGMDLCDNCADEVRAAGRCFNCGDLGIDVKLTPEKDNKRYCGWCAEDLDETDDDG
jgi:hypothetical protein